jgi:hypothetical protein
VKLIQPDRRSCGAAVLIMARRLMRPHYAARVADQAAFDREVVALHRRITSIVDTRGGLQVPWLRAIGTPPWAAARELRLLTGVPYAVHPTRRRGAAWQHLQHATPSRPMAAYVGDRWAPRHVVLVIGRVDEGVWVYEPARGHVTLVSRARWDEGPLRLAGWNQPWFVCAPT